MTPIYMANVTPGGCMCNMACSRCYNSDYKPVFVFIVLSFGDENKIPENPYSIVRLVYPLRPSLTVQIPIIVEIDY